MSGTLWLSGAVGITGAPPFGLFLERVHDSARWVSAVLTGGLRSCYGVLLIVIFIGFLAHFRAMYFDDAPEDEALRRGSVAGWPGARADVAGACSRSLVLGLWWPQPLWDFFTTMPGCCLGSAAMIGAGGT